MLRGGILSLVALAVVSSGVVAEEIRARVKSIDPTKNTITVMVGDQERTLESAKDVRVMTWVTTGRPRRGRIQEMATTLTNLRQGTPVTLSTQTRDDVEVVTLVRADTTYSYGGRPGLLRRRR